MSRGQIYPKKREKLTHFFYLDRANKEGKYCNIVLSDIFFLVLIHPGVVELFFCSYSLVTAVESNHMYE